MFRSKFSAMLVATLALGSLAMAAPASAGTGSAKSPDGQASIKISIADTYSGANPTRPIRVDITTPAPYIDSYSRSHNHRANIDISFSGRSCFKEGSGHYAFDNNVPTQKTFYLNWSAFLDNNTVNGKPGTCTVTAKLRVNATAWAPYSWEKVATAKTTFKVRAKTSLSTPKAVSKIKKGKTATLSGKATYKYKRTSYEGVKDHQKANVAKGTKLVLQQRVAGSKSFKNVKTIKVGSKGKWSVKVKPRKTTQYRVVLKKTSKYYAKTSSAKKITVVKK